MRQKGIKKWLSIKYDYTSEKMKQKMVVASLKCSLMVQTKRNQEKVVDTKIPFHGKTKQKMKDGSTKIQPDCSGKKKLEKEVTTKI